MSNAVITFLVFLVAMAVSALVYPVALGYAKRHNIVDNPNARKLQRVPVPVFGGVVVYSGILAGGLVLSAFMWNWVMVNGIIGMTIMLLIGVWDDRKDISALLRLFVEIALVSGFIALTGVYIDDFHGLWGINAVDDWIAIPLSVLGGVSIINAVNLIDGVDGYSSGYGMMACTLFGLCYWTVWSPTMTCMTIIVIGALLPFFMHNVFGLKSKMFIGDGGTLMLGTALTVMLFNILYHGSLCSKFEARELGLIPFTLAVMSIPVFDTLRVMTMRILRKKSLSLGTG